MRRFLFMLSIMTASATYVLADDYNYFSFESTDGSVQTFTAHGLEISFSDGNAVVTNGSEQATIPLSTLVRMAFTNDSGTTAIQSLSTQGDSRYDVWTVSGVYVGQFDSRTALGQLSHGVYVVRNNGKTQKMILP